MPSDRNKCLVSVRMRGDRHKCVVSVTIAYNYSGSPLCRGMTIIAAVDRSDRADQVIREAIPLAEAFDEPIHVVHVLTRGEFVSLGRTKAEEGESIDMDQVRSVAREIAAEAIEDAEISAKAVGLVGDPADRIVDYARNEEARYIVIAGRKKSPAGKAIFGSVVQSVLLNADCPVLSTISGT